MKKKKILKSNFDQDQPMLPFDHLKNDEPRWPEDLMKNLTCYEGESLKAMHARNGAKLVP